MSGRVRVILLASLCLSQLSCAQRDTPAPVERLYQGKSFRDFAAGSLQQPSYQVVAGDTLYAIAFRANVDVRQLAELNQLAEPYVIIPGQKLRLNVSRLEQQGVDPELNRGYRATKQQQNDDTKVKLSAATEIFASNNRIRWQWPASAPISADFSAAEGGIKGIDLSGSRGDPVYAAATGKVVYVGNALKGFGNLIILKHNDEYITAYAHNQQLLVKEQQWVNGGQQIATMGDSDAERVKLHFQVRFRGQSVNPRKYLPRGMP
jgi:lipoprotein NlpD